MNGRGLLGLPRIYWVLWAGQFINRLGGFVLTFLPLYLTERHGYSAAEAGAVLSLFGLGSLAGASLGGWAADRFGRRRTLLALLTFNGVVIAGFGVAPPGPLISLAAVLHGVSNGYGPALNAALSDVVTPSDRKRAFGYFYWAVNLGFTFAAVLGGAISRSGYQWLFVGDALTTFALVGIVYVLVPETRPAHVGERPSFAHSLRPLVDPRLAGFVVAQLLALIVFLQAFVTMPLQERAVGIPVGVVGLIAALNGVIIIVGQPLFLRLTQAISSGTLLAVAAAILCLAATAAARAHTATEFAVAMTLASLGEIAFSGAAPTFVAHIATPALRGSYQGAYSLCWAMASVVAPLLGPWGQARFGAAAMWRVAALVSVVALAMHVTLTRRAELRSA